ncbi:MAG: VOC family protein [Alphaproteobacteria bacterium]|nr:VOC family protein [Alphaproteobacteria bacterium]
MFNGAHVVVYSKDAEADRAFLRDVLEFRHVDVGGGWLIFALPPSEVAFHPHEKSQAHELYLMCNDVEACREKLAKAGVSTTGTVDAGWGLLSSLTLPGGGTIGFYQPRHGRPPQT